MTIKYYQGYLKFKHVFTIYVLFILHRAGNNAVLHMTRRPFNTRIYDLRLFTKCWIFYWLEVSATVISNFWLFNETSQIYLWMWINGATKTVHYKQKQ